MVPTGANEYRAGSGGVGRIEAKPVNIEFSRCVDVTNLPMYRRLTRNPIVTA